MKKWGIFVTAAISVVLVAFVAMHPRYRQGRLMSQLERAPSAEERARLIRDVIELDADSARDYLTQYAQEIPTFAFDPRHSVGLLSDTTSGDVYIAGDGMGGSFRMGGSPVPKFQEIQLLLSDELVTRFVLQQRNGLSRPEYTEYRFGYDRGKVKYEGIDDFSPEQITRWQAEGIWPF